MRFKIAQRDVKGRRGCLYAECDAIRIFIGRVAELIDGIV